MSFGLTMSMMENKDLTTGPEQRRKAADVLRRFSEKYLSQLNMSNIRATLDEEDGTDDLWLESCSFDIMLQLLYISYGKMLQRVSGNKADGSIFASVGNEKSRNETIAGTVLAPETMAIVSDKDSVRDEDKSDRLKKKKRKYVPETSFLFEDDHDEVFGNSEKKKRPPVAEVKTGEWLRAEKSKKSGKDPEPLDDSPSLLKGRRKKDGVIAKENVKEDEDDFVECVKSKSAEGSNRRGSPRKASSSSAPVSTTAKLSKKVKVTNKFGIQMDEEWTMSQKRRVQNMRQGKIKQFLGAKNDTSAGASEDMERARLESLKTYEKEKRSRSPLGMLDNSFDRLTSDDDDEPDKGNLKCQEAPVRTKKGRAALQGVDCAECRAFYANENLGTEALDRVLQACSKHRVANKPTRSDSPQQPWDLDFREGGPAEKTQAGSPLKVRKRRSK